MKWRLSIFEVALAIASAERNLRSGFPYCCNQIIEIFQERTDILNLRVSAVTGDRTNFEVSLMQSLQIFILLSAADNDHRVIMASQNKVYHQSGNTAVPILKGVNAYIAVME